MIAQDFDPTTSETQQDWQACPLSELADHIVAKHHHYLRRELPVLRERMLQVLQAHGADLAFLPEVAANLDNLAEELMEHIALEEQVVFPWLLSAEGPQAHRPVSKLVHDHDDSLRLLGRLRQLTDDYRLPAGSCVTLEALYFGLEALEKDVSEHIRLENDLLFPRALSMAPC